MGAAQNHASNMPAIETIPTDHTHSAEVARQSAGPRLTLEQYFTEPNNKEEPDCESLMLLCVVMHIAIIMPRVRMRSEVYGSVGF